MPIIAESFGALAVLLNFIGYRQNKINHYRFISALALMSVSTHFFLLGAMAAGIGCLLASIRNLIAMRYRNNMVLYLFVGLNLAFFAYEWWILQHGWEIIIAYTSSLIFTVGSIVLQSPTRIRQWFILAELLGLTYALMVGSIFGSIFNISNLVSIGLTLYQQRARAEAK